MEYDLKKFLDLSFPLLEKFRDIAPGSFRHCQIVANICESIALDLNLNIDLVKCAALYHDIGKMNSPEFFSENQPQDYNPHDKLKASISYQIISKHVGDSILILLQYPDIPKKVLDIISQHHGNSIIRAFYNKSSDSPEDNFRYKCQTPKCKESSVLMIVDSCEATVRSLINGKDNNEIISDTINSTINKLIDDNQLNYMRIGTLKIVKKILIKDLQSIHHKRILYEKNDEKTIGEIKGDKK